MTQPAGITQILKDWSEGDPTALDALIPLVYQELRRLAHRALNKNSGGGNFQTTVLVNEAYLHLVDIKKISWQDRTHFFAVSANLMRNILVDHARLRSTDKRRHQKVELDTQIDGGQRFDLIELDSALMRLGVIDAQLMDLVEMRYFGGMTVADVTSVTGVPEASVKRRWQTARAWLADALANPIDHG